MKRKEKRECINVMQMFIVIGMFYAHGIIKNFRVEKNVRRKGKFYRSFKESCKLEHNNFTNLNFMER